MTRVSQSYAAVPAEQRGQLIGVVPTRVVQMGRRATYCDLLFEVQTMSERKQRMRDLADGFVCLPGSYGTLDEMYDVIAAGTVGEHKKPLYVLNYKGFYDHLKAEAAHMKELSFLPKQEIYAPQFVPTLDELYPLLDKN